MKTILSLLLLASALHAAEPNTVINRWLAHQTNIQAWSAEFTQTRTLQALSHPLVSTGQLWFAAPQNFRWELGRDQTIAIRSNETMLVVYPRLKRAEKYNFENAGRSEWKDTLALLQSGFPRSRAELDHQFNLISIAQTNDLVQLHLQPKSLGARKMMPRINVLLHTNFTLAGTELVFIDGSRMRNDFHAIHTNADTSGKFDLIVPANFKLVEPMKGRK